MSTFQPSFHSPPSRKVCSPAQTPSNCLSPESISHCVKSKAKASGKSPSANKEKPSPQKNLSLKSGYDTKLTSLVSPTRSKNNRYQEKHQSSAAIPRKNNQIGKEDMQKTKGQSANTLPFDNQVENKVRRSDHLIVFPEYDIKVPYKQKSHSVKSVSIPQELLLSPKVLDTNTMSAAMNKKVHTTKHSNGNEIDLLVHPNYGPDLLTFYNNIENKQKLENRKKRTQDIERRNLNTPETSPPSRIHNESKKKLERKVSPRAYEALVGSPARIQGQRQEALKIMSNNYMHGPLQNIPEKYEDNGKDYEKTNSSSLSVPISNIYETKAVKDSENRARTGSVQEAKNFDYIDAKEYSGSPLRPKTTKHSEPNIYSNPNIYSELFGNGKVRELESQVNQHQVMQGGNKGFSTRSVIEKSENMKTEMKAQKDKEGDKLISKLLKRSALKELKVNPNAKFLLLREQIREKRNKTGFKSTDWNANENAPNFMSQHQTSPAKTQNASPFRSRTLYHSPAELKSAEVSRSPQREVKDENVRGNEAIANDQLVQLFNKTKSILDSYKHKEINWERERKIFITEIQRLRELVDQGAN